MAEGLSRHLCGSVKFPVQLVDSKMKEVIPGVFEYEAELMEEAVLLGRRNPAVFNYYIYTENSRKRTLTQRLTLAQLGLEITKLACGEGNGAENSVLAPIAVHAYGVSQNYESNPKFSIDLPNDFRVVNCSGQKLAIRTAKKRIRSWKLDAGLLTPTKFAKLWQAESNPRFCVIFLPEGEDWGFPFGVDLSVGKLFDEKSQAGVLIQAALEAGAGEDSLFSFINVGRDSGFDGGEDDDDTDLFDPVPDPVLHAPSDG